METRIVDSASELSLTTTATATTTATESEKAWHFLAILLSLGRPARPAELASRCALFRATSDLVESLCSIPNSPLFFTADLHVTLSPLALTSLAQFAATSNLIHLFSPSRIRIGVPQAYWLWNQIDFVTTCSRKRKLISFSDCELSPVPKRRAILNYTVGKETFFFVLFKKKSNFVKAHWILIINYSRRRGKNVVVFAEINSVCLSKGIFLILLFLVFVEFNLNCNSNCWSNLLFQYETMLDLNLSHLLWLCEIQEDSFVLMYLIWYCAIG